jgi:hypothetical protein
MTVWQFRPFAAWNGADRPWGGRHMDDRADLSSNQCSERPKNRANNGVGDTGLEPVTFRLVDVTPGGSNVELGVSKR